MARDVIFFFIPVFRYSYSPRGFIRHGIFRKLANVQFVYFRLMNMLPSKIESNGRQTAAPSSLLYSPPFKSRSTNGGRKKCTLSDTNQSPRRGGSLNTHWPFQWRLVFVVLWLFPLIKPLPTNPWHLNISILSASKVLIDTSCVTIDFPDPASSQSFERSLVRISIWDIVVTLN
jgi:hypothetical protein